MADSLGDLGWPVEDRILVLNVLRGLSDRYSYLRTWITRQRPFPTFLQVRDDLVMEELTQGLQPGSTSALGPSSSSSTPEIDLSSVFPTDPVVDPPLQLFPAGTAMSYPSPGPCPNSPVTRDTPGPAPCHGLEGSPSRPAPAPEPRAGPGPLTLAPPAHFAQPVLICQRRARPAPLPPAPLVSPSSLGSPTPPAVSSPPAHQHHRRGPRLPVSRRRCTTHRSFTDTRNMFTLW